MKTLYFISGTMGVGKSAVCQLLKNRLDNCVFLDGDWCWDAHPFKVTDETKRMVVQNICFLLNQFLRCSAYDNVVFCWVMHRQSIIDSILARMELSGCMVKSISLVCDEESLKARLLGDVEKGLRKPDVIERSLARLSLYAALDTLKVDTSGKSVAETADEIMCL